jgi:predicted N-acetyltransferase YhbS
MRITTPDLSTGLDQLAATFGEAFSDYWETHRYPYDGYLVDAPYDAAAGRVGWEGDTLVTHFGVWRQELRVGTAPLTVACIGAVATHNAFRKRGLMAQTVRASIESFRGLGYDASLLFGISDFYQKFGYVTMFPEYVYDVTWSNLPSNVPDALVRCDNEASADPMRAPWDEVAELYNHGHQDVTLTAVRPTYRRNRRPHRWTLWTWRDPAGALRGYVVVQRDPDADVLKVVDATGPPPEVCGVLRRIAVESVCPTISFIFTPPRSPLGRYLRTLDAKLVVRYSSGGGSMMRLVNLHSTLTKTAPELSRRLARSAARRYRGTLRIAVDGESVDLCIGEGAITVNAKPAAEPDAIIAGDHRFSRLLFGCGAPELSSAGLDLSGDAEILLSVLFPDQEPSLVVWDHF